MINKPKSPWEAAMSSNVLLNATLNIDCAVEKATCEHIEYKGAFTFKG